MHADERFSPRVLSRHAVCPVSLELRGAAAQRILAQGALLLTMPAPLALVAAVAVCTILATTRLMSILACIGTRERMAN